MWKVIVQQFPLLSWSNHGSWHKAKGSTQHKNRLLNDCFWLLATLSQLLTLGLGWLCIRKLSTASASMQFFKLLGRVRAGLDGLIVNAGFEGCPVMTADIAVYGPIAQKVHNLLSDGIDIRSRLGWSILSSSIGRGGLSYAHWLDFYRGMKFSGLFRCPKVKSKFRSSSQWRQASLTASRVYVTLIILGMAMTSAFHQ